MNPSAQSQWKEPSSLMQASLSPGHAIARSLHSSISAWGSEIRQFKIRKSGRLSYGNEKYVNQRYVLTKTLSSFQFVATWTFLTACRTTTHAAHTRLVTAWVQRGQSGQHYTLKWALNSIMYDQLWIWYIVYSDMNNHLEASISYQKINWLLFW